MRGLDPRKGNFLGRKRHLAAMGHCLRKTLVRFFGPLSAGPKTPLTVNNRQKWTRFEDRRKMAKIEGPGAKNPHAENISEEKRDAILAAVSASDAKALRRLTKRRETLPFFHDADGRSTHALIWACRVGAQPLIAPILVPLSDETALQGALRAAREDGRNDWARLIDEEIARRALREGRPEAPGGNEARNGFNKS